jgi:zinc transport system substrate-binding protein
MKRCSSKIVLMLVLGLLAASLFAAGERASEEAAGGRAVLEVFVTIQPQRFFVEQLGGSRVRVEALVDPGRDPHTFDPSPRQVARLARADLYLTIGMPFETSLVPKLKSANRQLGIVDTVVDIEWLYGVPHYHYDENGKPVLHAADDPDPHVWLGPREVRQQIVRIRDALIAADPAGRDEYMQRHAEFDAKVAAMDQRFRSLLAPARGRSILAFHPAFAYFTNTYGIRQVAIELDGKEPSPRHLERMIDQALRDGTRVIFTQPEFPMRSAEVIAKAINGRVVVLNPLDSDWFGVMETMARAIAEGVF